MNTNNDVPMNIKDVVKEYPMVDFSLFDSFKEPELWFLETLDKEV